MTCKNAPKAWKMNHFPAAVVGRRSLADRVSRPCTVLDHLQSEGRCSHLHAHPARPLLSRCSWSNLCISVCAVGSVGGHMKNSIFPWLIYVPSLFVYRQETSPASSVQSTLSHCLQKSCQSHGWDKQMFHNCISHSFSSSFPDSDFFPCLELAEKCSIFKKCYQLCRKYEGLGLILPGIKRVRVLSFILPWNQSLF